MTFTREDYELAALAAGVELRFLSGCIPFSDGPIIGEWNPPESKADAFDLMARLKLNVAQGDFSAGVNDEADIDNVYVVKGEAERCQVLCHAIFRAAIEIGRDMKAKQQHSHIGREGE